MTDEAKKETARLVLDFLHRLALHHGMWYAEVRERLGKEKGEDVFRKAYETSAAIQWKRIAKTLGVEMDGDVPAPLADLPQETLGALKEAVAVNWLANDGVWFQAVETTEGMDAAKACNDACWARFSPVEAWSIRRLLGLSDRPGLDGLKRALDWRLYAAINEQSIDSEDEKGFVFRMNRCRVQEARKRKGLPDYPCKSAGIVEYTTFAASIDPRIRTECVGCPPDDHPDEWYCAWRFVLEG
jgi:hypothetical protein